MSTSAPVKQVQSASKDAMMAIFGNSKGPKGSSEPPSFFEGNGSVDFADKAQSGTEPKSGEQGSGTIDSPYDKGNVEGEEQSGTEPVSGAHGEGTVDSPYDKGNKDDPMENPQSQETPLDPKKTGSTDVVTSGATNDDAEAKAVAEQAAKLKNTQISDRSAPTAPPPSSGTPAAAQPPEPPTSAATTTPNTSKPEPPAADRGRTLQPESAGGRFERSVSPGTLDDGTHAVTSGERGESYVPSSKMGKLKDKMFGKH